jgi:DNA-binding response OmpR family regulator
MTQFKNDKEKILVVDDEPSVVEVVSIYLRKEGYEVLTAYTGPEALRQIKEHRPTLVVLDIMIPEIDGLAILSTIQQDQTDTAVIVLSARRQEVDRIYGLELGADDYMTKPFSPAELVARVKAVLRRLKAPAPEVAGQTLTFENNALSINPESHQVLVQGELVELTATEFNLLWFMANHPNQVFSRDQMLKKIWGYSDFVDPNTVTVHMRRIREKIEPDPAKPLWLQTVWGVGYKFSAERDSGA